MTIIGLDIGGSKCAVLRASDDGVIERTLRFATGAAAQTQERLYEAVAQLKPGPAPVFGVSCGGPLDSRCGLIKSPPNLPGWDDVPICAELERRFGGRAFLMNDANAGALAEWRFGAAKGARHLVFLTCGTGMGAGIICDGRVYEGSTGNAGEIGHMRLSPRGPRGYGKAGSFEGWCSGGGLARLAQQRAREHNGKVAFNPGTIEHITARDLVLAAADGDQLAQNILQESGQRLGQALSIIIDIINPEIIVLGSMYHRAQQFIEPAMRDALAAEALPDSLNACRITPTALGEDIGSYAAVAIAVYHAAGFAADVDAAVHTAMQPLQRSV